MNQEERIAAYRRQLLGAHIALSNAAVALRNDFEPDNQSKAYYAAKQAAETARAALNVLDEP